MTIEYYPPKNQEHVCLCCIRGEWTLSVMKFDYLAWVSSSKIPKWLFSAFEQTTK